MCLHASQSCFTNVCCNGEGKQAFRRAQTTTKAADWMGPKDLVVCNKCTRHKESSGPDVGKTRICLISAHFC